MGVSVLVAAGLHPEFNNINLSVKKTRSTELRQVRKNCSTMGAPMVDK